MWQTHLLCHPLLDLLFQKADDHFSLWVDSRCQCVKTHNEIICLLTAFRSVFAFTEALNTDFFAWLKKFLNTICKNSFTQNNTGIVNVVRPHLRSCCLQCCDFTFNEWMNIPIVSNGYVLVFILLWTYELVLLYFFCLPTYLLYQSEDTLVF